jgi:hypothetical protein
MSSDIRTVNQKKCSHCGALFTCGNIDKNNQCWCNDYPALFRPDSGIDCLCPDCLKAACSDKIENYVSSLTPEAAINNKAKDLPKIDKLIEGLDYYIEDGKYVFKSWYHLKRGNCCENGCRHCPYGYKKQKL